MNQIDPLDTSLVLDLALVVDSENRQMMAMGDGWYTELVPVQGAAAALKPLVEEKLGVTFTSANNFYLLIQMIHIRNAKNGKNSAHQPYPMEIGK